MAEAQWTRVIEAVQVVAEQRQISVPFGLLHASGNLWTRNTQRYFALRTFLSQIEAGFELPVLYQESMDLTPVADHLDQLALTAMEDSPALEESSDAVESER